MALKAAAEADWTAFVERLSVVEQTLREDPVGVYGQMDKDTRDSYRHAVERLARRSPGDRVRGRRARRRARARRRRGRRACPGLRPRRLLGRRAGRARTGPGGRLQASPLAPGVQGLAAAPDPHLPGQHQARDRRGSRRLGVGAPTPLAPTPGGSRSRGAAALPAGPRLRRHVRQLERGPVPAPAPAAPDGLCGRHPRGGPHLRRGPDAPELAGARARDGGAPGGPRPRQLRRRSPLRAPLRLGRRPRGSDAR